MCWLICVGTFGVITMQQFEYYDECAVQLYGMLRYFYGMLRRESGIIFTSSTPIRSIQFDHAYQLCIRKHHSLNRYPKLCFLYIVWYANLNRRYCSRQIILIRIDYQNHNVPHVKIFVLRNVNSRWFLIRNILLKRAPHLYLLVFMLNRNIQIDIENHTHVWIFSATFSLEVFPL